MPRVKRGTMHVKRRSNLLKRAKGFKWGRKKRIRLARTAVTKAGANAFRGRRQKKHVNKAIWNTRINAASRPLGVSYSQLRAKLRQHNILLDRKTLATLANNFPTVFAQLLKQL